MHMFAPGSIKALCGKRVTTIAPCFNNRVDCADCLVRHDAMLTRGWQQEEWHVWYNTKRYVAWRVKEAKNNIRYFPLPRGAIHRVCWLWDKETLKAALKMARLGDKDFA